MENLGIWLVMIAALLYLDWLRRNSGGLARPGPRTRAKKRTPPAP